MAFTSSELTMLSILLQNTPDAVGSTMMEIKTQNRPRSRNAISEVQKRENRGAAGSGADLSVRAVI
ncbi:hypothetical protein EYF80_018858 [Liparis tanakae]|uniref:Uncharacterized protein n=1 Tax=Liparis tanakae TaxID=230148 RepID=A0A4Z2I0X3_9TELE|nr:hypothetical protein EYF80_018858 [Liparis tanakae]